MMWVENGFLRLYFALFPTIYPPAIITTGGINMDASRLNEFREALRYLSFNGITLKEFAKKINVKPHTLYNYISGQKPSFKNYNYILYVLERDYPAAIAESREIIRQGEKL